MYLGLVVVKPLPKSVVSCCDRSSSMTISRPTCQHAYHRGVDRTIGGRVPLLQHRADLAVQRGDAEGDGLALIRPLRFSRLLQPLMWISSKSLSLAKYW